jgi:hypothetical protein
MKYHKRSYQLSDKASVKKYLSAYTRRENHFCLIKRILANDFLYVTNEHAKLINPVQKDKLLYLLFKISLRNYFSLWKHTILTTVNTFATAFIIDYAWNIHDSVILALSLSTYPVTYCYFCPTPQPCVLNSMIKSDRFWLHVSDVLIFGKTIKISSMWHLKLIVFFKKYE